MKVYKTITKSTQRLLDGQEGLDVDFKRDVPGLKPDTLVSFANSSNGGVILIGIGEDKKSCPFIYGCPVGDKERNIIQSRANDCHPPIKIRITVENTEQNPFFRIDIPRDNFKNRPFRTRAGEYSIRSDGQKRALSKDELLGIFLEREEASFLDRFAQASGHLKLSLDSIEDEFAYFADEAKLNFSEILGEVEDAQRSLNEAVDLLYKDDLSRKIDFIKDGIKSLNQKVNVHSLALREILGEQGVPESIKKYIASDVRTNLSIHTAFYFRQGEDVSQDDRQRLAEHYCDVYPFVTPDFILSIFNEMIEDGKSGKKEPDEILEALEEEYKNLRF